MRGTSRRHVLNGILALAVTGIALHTLLFANIRLFTVVSGSMSPAMPTGSYILVTNGQYELLKPGDIATFRKDDIIITHRVMDLGYDGSFYYITKGDANKLPDPEPVRHHQILGRVVFIAPPIVLPLLTFLRNRTALLLLSLFLLIGIRQSVPAKKPAAVRQSPRFFRPTHK